jgi:glycosyltransferase involved in cell wall biosynthesis
MKLDVVIPTYNRSALLRLTLASLLRAPIPPQLDVTIIVIDNNSHDDTPQVVQQIQTSTTRPIIYVKETRQGSSRSRNAGIAAGTGELIGFIDDDEEIEEHWFQVVAREFEDPSTQFIGGPYLAQGNLPMPAWLPPGYNGVIGIHPLRPRARFGAGFTGNLNSGNAVLRRNVFDQVGLYDVHLGRSGTGLLSEEDAELYRRISAAGLRGFHVPDLVIYHHIPAARLTRRYHRSWCYWRGVSHGIADRNHREATAYLLGIPRYRIRQALQGLLYLPFNMGPHHGSGTAFHRELALWDLLGFIRGKYFARVQSLYADQSK